MRVHEAAAALGIAASTIRHQIALWPRFVALLLYTALVFVMTTRLFRKKVA